MTILAGVGLLNMFMGFLYIYRTYKEFQGENREEVKSKYEIVSVLFTINGSIWLVGDILLRRLDTIYEIGMLNIDLWGLFN